MRILSFAVMAVLVVDCASWAVSNDQYWPQWRGSAGNSSSPAQDVVSKWGPDQNVKWKIGLPEPGNSSPIVWGERVFYTQPLTESQLRTLVCVDRESGRELWQRGVKYDQPEATHKTNPYCSASPATDGERVIAWFGSAGLICWDMDGNELWRRELGKQEHMWGYGSSPILYQDLCILLFGPGNSEFLLAVNKFTGETHWQVPTLDDAAERALSGPENDGGSNDYTSEEPRRERLRGAWSTPIIVDIDGHHELIVTLPRRVAAFDPATGTQLWTCGGGAPLAYASPMASEGIVVALGGYGGASLAVKAGGSGDVTQSHRLWHKSRDSGWLGTGIIDDGVMYACDMGGVLKCIDVQTGEELWQARVGGGSTWSSIIQVGDGRMFLLSKSGTTTVFRPNATAFQLVAENKLDESTNASVTVAGADLFIRTDASLWCISETAN